jgi:carbonic anhydrase
MLKNEKDHLFHDNVAYANVENSLEEILTRSEIIKEMFAKGEIGLVGGMYNIENGKVDFFKNLTKSEKKQKSHNAIKEPV